MSQIPGPLWHAPPLAAIACIDVYHIVDINLWVFCLYPTHLMMFWSAIGCRFRGRTRVLPLCLAASSHQFMANPAGALQRVGDLWERSVPQRTVRPLATFLTMTGCIFWVKIECFTAVPPSKTETDRTWSCWNYAAQLSNFITCVRPKDVPIESEDGPEAERFGWDHWTGYLSGEAGGILGEDCSEGSSLFQAFGFGEHQLVGTKRPETISESFRCRERCPRCGWCQKAAPQPMRKTGRK